MSIKQKYIYSGNRAKSFNGTILLIIAPAMIAILIGDQMNSMFGIYFAAVYELLIVAAVAYTNNNSFRVLAKKTIIIEKILIPMVACINYANNRLRRTKRSGYFFGLKVP